MTATLLALSSTVLFLTGQMTEALADVLELGAAVLAAASCGIAARRSRRRLRASWAARSAACARWAVGEAIWTVYEVGLHRATPFPSLADVGFLAFPVGATVALLLFPANASHS